MKVCVFGAGVIGGVLASAIAQAGHETSVIARGAHLDAIKANGLTVATPASRVTTHPRASINPADFGPQDFVIVATKTPALPEVAKTIAPLLHADTTVAFSVNGVFWFYGDDFAPSGAHLELPRLDPTGDLHRNVGGKRAAGLVAWCSGEIKTPGVVTTAAAGGRFVAGASARESVARVERLVSDLNVTDVSLSSTSDIRASMWQKYIGIIGNFVVCSLTGGTIAQVHGDQPTQEIILRLMAEAHNVATAHGFTTLDFDLEKLRANPNRSQHKPSMLQDLERGRPMELDSALWALQDLARQAKIATPTLDVIAPPLTLKARLAGCA